MALPTHTHACDDRSGVWRNVVALACLVLVAFGCSLWNPFVFDDERIVRTCSKLSCLWPLHPRVVGNLTFFLNGWVFGMQPPWFRAVNLVFHLAAALALFGIVRRTLLLPAFGERYASAASKLACATAAVWAVHPVQTESVVYVCQRYESLMGMFYLLTLYGFIRGCTSSRHARRWHNIALASCLLGMGTKGVMITAPLMVLLYDRLFLSGPVFGPTRMRWRIHLALCATIGTAIALTSLYRENAMDTYVEMSRIVAYLLTQFRVVAQYLRLAFVPYPLCLDYGWEPVRNWQDVVLPAIPVLALLAATVWAVWRRKFEGYLGAWFFGILAPTSSFLPIDDVIFEHRMYLPLAGVVVLVVVGTYRWASGHDRSAFAKHAVAGRIAVLAVILIGILAGLTAMRCRVYSSELRLWQSVVNQQPDNLRARNDLAAALCEARSYTAAQLHFDYVMMRTANVPDFDRMGHDERGKQIRNNSPRFNRFRCLTNMGLVATMTGRLEAAVTCYARALRLIPYGEEARKGLVQALQLQGIEPAGIEPEIRRRLNLAGERMQ